MEPSAATHPEGTSLSTIEARGHEHGALAPADTAARTPSSARSWRNTVRDSWRVARLTAVSGGLTILGSIAVAGLGQSLEATRVLAEEAAAGRPWPLLLAFACAAVASLLAWYWARVTLYVMAPAAAADSRATRTARRVMPRLWGAVPLIALGVACLRAAGLRLTGERVHGILTVAWVAAFALAAALVVLLKVRRRYFAEPTLPAADASGRGRVRDLPRVTLALLATTTILWVVLFGAVWSTVGQGVRWMDPVSIVLLSIGLWIPVASFLAYLGAVLRLPVLRSVLALALLFTGCNLNDNHTVRHERVERPASPIDVNTAFSAWLSSRADLAEYDSYPVIFVAAEGGGLRAAYFTALVLTALQDRCPAFAQHVFAISSVSGGSVGAAVYSALAARHARNAPGQACAGPLAGPGRLQRQADSVLSRDLLTPLVGMGLFPDLLQRFLFFPVRSFDRARGLEVGLERAWTDVMRDSAFSQPFDSLWTDFPRGAVPALFFNTTRVKTGERVVISPLNPLDERFNRLVTLRDVAGNARISLSTASFLSARFPYVTPEGVLPGAGWPSAGRERLVDGGYFENSGATTLNELLAALRVGEPSSAPGRPRFTPIVLRIGFTSRDRPAGDVPRAKFSADALSEVLSPVRALLNARGARGASAVQQLTTTVTTLQDNGHPAELVEFELREEAVPLVLGWLMSSRARQDMTRQLTPARDCAQVSGIENGCSYGSVIRLLAPAPQAPVTGTPPGTTP